MRLQVFLSHGGACSRRKALALILSGKVSVNGALCLEPSHPVDPDSDTVLLFGAPVSLKKKIYLLLNKPSGTVTTAYDRFAPKTVLDLLPKEFRHLHPAGRLDKDTKGLLLLTNDGDLAYRLTHPSFEVNKTYRARLSKPMDDRDIQRLEKGVLLDAKKTAPCKIKKVSPAEVEMTIHEGRKRQVRRMFALLNYGVLDLIRIKQGSLDLGGLKTGAWRLLAPQEVAQLYKDVGLDP